MRLLITISILAVTCAPLAGNPASDANIEKAKGDHWAYQPIVSPAVPKIETDGQVHPIDAFVLNKLNAANMRPAAPADRRTLIRRAYFDLTGLPPTYEEVEAFVADARPDAYENVIDALLASPRFGERFGRHWLDVARYADTIGYDGGGRQRRFPFAWTYRDYVIDAFNADKPFDRFIVEQIAADRLDLPEGDPAMAGLGMLTVGRQFLGNQHNIIDDQIDVVTRGFMGLTVQCARCHDHKYDAVPTTDYYALYGVFRSMSAAEVDGMPVIGEAQVSEKQRDDYRKQLAAKEKAIDDHLSSVRHVAEKELRERTDEYFDLVTGKRDNINNERQKLRRDIAAVWREIGSPKPINETHRATIIAKVAANIHANPAGYFIQNERDEFNKRKGHIIELMSGNPAAPPRAMIVNESSPFRPHVFVRGNAGHRGEKVDRRFLSVLGGERFTEGSGRLELANLIASKNNPLTARVWVNRVWMHLFDHGLVRTPGDFGVRGQPPTHPALLDYLAARFMRDGWSTKQLIRFIVTSKTYRQSSLATSDDQARDPENRLIRKMNRKRLSFEPMHDALAFVAGSLDATMHGRPVQLFAGASKTRRAVYGYIDRQDLPQTLRAFDFASPDASTQVRSRTTVPQQALFMMNSPFVDRHAKSIAAKLEAIQDQTQRVITLYRTVLSRTPSDEEIRLALDFVASDTEAGQWQRLTQALLQSNEFVFVD